MLIKRIANIFVCESQYHERDIPKGAGFWWNPAPDQCNRKNCIPCKLELYKVWWTENIENAFKLMEWADNDTKDFLQNEKKKREQSLEMSKQVHSNFSVKIPNGLNLYPFQLAGVEFMSQRNNTLLSDEMGLGKSIESIGFINLNNFEKILIVCPNTLKLNWKNELEKWLIKDYKIHIAESNLHFGIPKDINIIIINYDILLDSVKKKNCGDIELRSELKQDFDLLIADEVHKCKNNKTLRAKLFYKIKAKKKVYLTGTPVLNKVGELFHIINSLDPKTFPNRWRFLHRFTNFYHNGYGYVSEGGKNLDELNRLLRSTIMIRRLKRDVLKELPPKARQIIEIPANGLENIIEKEQQTLGIYEELLSRLKADLELSKLSDDPEEYRQAVKNLKMASGIAFTEIARIRHETALAKLPVTIDYIKDLLEEHDKIVIFAHHRDVIQSIFNNFKEIAVYLTGECNIQHRQDAIDNFQNNSNIRIFIGSIQAAGVGITLTASNFVLFVEMDWVPSNMEQGIDRLHRIGTINPVLAQYFVLQDSIDAKMAKTIIEKQELIEKALGDVEVEIEKDEPIIPVEGVTTTKQRVREEAKLITPEQIDHVIDGLKIIAEMDSDRASLKNDIGFSKVDTYIGNSLAQLDNLTNRQAALGRKLLLKYWRQLPKNIINNIKILEENHN
ncbi:MAG: DEAD/DEAH box helicase [Candidatus Hodarchaeota archaeon]